MCAKVDGYSFETDIWSLGATFYHIVNSSSPFSEFIKNNYALDDIKTIKWMLKD